MNLLAAINYDPSTAVSKATTALIAMTALDTTNLRSTVTVPASGTIYWKIQTTLHGASTYPNVLLGVLDGSTVRGRKAAMLGGNNLAATTRCAAWAEGIITGLTPGASITLDAAYGVEITVASTGLKYGGPNNTTTDDAWGAISFELWDPRPLPTAAPGASGGVLISGSNAGTTTLGALTITGATTHTGHCSFADGIAVTCSTTDRTGLVVTGNGVAHGALFSSGSGSTGDGIRARALSTNGHGFNGLGTGTGAGFLLTGGATGSAWRLVGGATSGHAMQLTTTSGNGIDIQPTAGHGILALANGTDKHGAILTGGTAGTSDGLKAVAGTGGVPIRGDITGNVTGNLSGSVGSVTGAVGSVTGNVGGNVNGSVATVTALAANSVNASALAADAVTEIQNGLATAAALATVAGYVDTEVASIKATTDKLETMIEPTSGSPTDYRWNADSLTHVPTVDEIGDEVQGRTIAAVTAVGTVGTVNALAANSVNAAALAGDAVAEIQNGLSTLTAAQVNAEVDTALADVGLTSTVTGRIDAAVSTRASQASVDAIDDYVDSEVGAIKVVTDKLHTTLEIGAGSPGEYRFSADALVNAPSGEGGGSAPSAAAIAAAVWAEALPGSYGAGEAGKIVGDNLNATVGSRLAAASYTAPLDAAGTRSAVGLASANLDTQLSGINAKTTNLPADPADASDIAAAFGTVNGKLDVIDDLLDTEVAAIKAKTDNLPSDPADQSALEALIGTPAGASLAADVAAVKAETAAILVDTGTTLDGKVDAIKGKTDGLTFTGSAIDSNVVKVNDTDIDGSGTALDPWGPA